MLDRAVALGFDAVATGHYAQLSTGDDGTFEMHRADGPGQGPVLRARRAHPGAARALDVPARRLPQDQVRDEAERARPRRSPRSPTATTSASSPTATPPAGCATSSAPAPATIVDHATGEVLGSHDGSHQFTIGQRQGLRLGRPAADGKPRFVLDIEPVSGTVDRRAPRGADRRPDRGHPAPLVRGRAGGAAARHRPAAGARRRAPGGGRRRRGHGRHRAARPRAGHRAGSGRASCTTARGSSAPAPSAPPVVPRSTA